MLAERRAGAVCTADGLSWHPTSGPLLRPAYCSCRPKGDPRMTLNREVKLCHLLQLCFLRQREIQHQVQASNNLRPDTSTRRLRLSFHLAWQPLKSTERRQHRAVDSTRFSNGEGGCPLSNLLGAVAHPMLSAQNEPRLARVVLFQ